MIEFLGQLEQAVNDLKQIVPRVEQILQELLCPSPPPVRLETIENFLRSIRQLPEHGELGVVEQLREQAETSLESLRHWLAVADLGISPFILRTHLEKKPPEAAGQRAWIRYFLAKKPHAESDRDKLDYLLSAHFIIVHDSEVEPRYSSAKELRKEIDALFAEPVTQEPEAPVQVMLHELESLLARVNDFQDFDQLVGARMVERARALKINLGENFYHPQALTTVVRFNVTFRRHFEKLFRHQIEQVKAQTTAFIEAARQILTVIEEAFEDLPVPTETWIGAGPGSPPVRDSEARIGRPFEVTTERPPIDRLVHRHHDPQKEAELRGIIKRIARHLAALPEGEAAGRIVFPLRHATLEIYDWEREGFTAGAEKQAPVSAETIQTSLGLIAWMEEEHTLYEKNRPDRYQWKPHFDMLSYAVEHTHDQLHTIYGLLEEGGPPTEATLFPALVNTAQRLLKVLEKVAPVFA